MDHGSTALVLFMTLPGLALSYGGLVRVRNVLSVLMQCFAIAGIVSIVWLVCGYSLAFGEGNAYIGTPASGFVGPGGALIIGVLAGIICFNATMTLKNVLKIDDSLDVFPVHGVGGIVGTLLAGVFASTSLGVSSGQGFAESITSMGGQLWIQLIGVGATIVWTAGVTWVILKLINVVTALRVSEDDEAIGLDLTSHEERGCRFNWSLALAQ